MQLTNYESVYSEVRIGKEGFIQYRDWIEQERVRISNHGCIAVIKRRDNEIALFLYRCKCLVSVDV